MVDTQETSHTHVEQDAPVLVKEDPSQVITRKVTRAVWIFASIIYALLGFRFLLKLFGANPNSPFSLFIYAVTDFLVFPFHNLMGNPAFGNSVFELTTLIATLVYIFLTWLLVQFVLLIFKRE